MKTVESVLDVRPDTDFVAYAEELPPLTNSPAASGVAAWSVVQAAAADAATDDAATAND